MPFSGKKDLDRMSVMNEIKESITVRSPGRINLIGEHTDYNDGYVLPAAIDKSITMAIRKNGSDSRVYVEATNLSEVYSFQLDKFSPLKSGWQNYIMGVVHELLNYGANIKGFDAKFGGDVPIGGGMSSSAALECSLAYALNELFDLRFSKAQLIKASQMAEHNFVGIKCGIMDQFASMMGKKDQVILLDCRSLDYKYYPLELGNYQLLLLDTNVSHELASSEYNTRRSECVLGVTILKKTYPDINSLRDVTEKQIIQIKDQLPDVIYRRCHHVISENERVLEATNALIDGDFKRLGELIYQSHDSLQYNYEVSCPELDFLVSEAKTKPYVLGSRMMGGGFGGSTLNLIEKRKVDNFVDDVSKSYFQKFEVDLTAHTVNIEDGTKVI